MAGEALGLHCQFAARENYKNCVTWWLPRWWCPVAASSTDAVSGKSDLTFLTMFGRWGLLLYTSSRICTQLPLDKWALLADMIIVWAQRVGDSILLCTLEVSAGQLSPHPSCCCTNTGRRHLSKTLGKGKECILLLIIANDFCSAGLSNKFII